MLGKLTFITLISSEEKNLLFWFQGFCKVHEGESEPEYIFKI